MELKTILAIGLVVFIVGALIFLNGVNDIELIIFVSPFKLSGYARSGNYLKNLTVDWGKSLFVRAFSCTFGDNLSLRCWTKNHVSLISERYRRCCRKRCDRRIIFCLVYHLGHNR